MTVCSLKLLERLAFWLQLPACRRDRPGSGSIEAVAPEACVSYLPNPNCTAPIAIVTAACVGSITGIPSASSVLRPPAGFTDLRFTVTAYILPPIAVASAAPLLLRYPSIS
jgi:hypothetical protein